MRTVLVGLFWLWLLVALGVYAYRIWRRITRGPAKERPGEDELAGAAAPVVPTPTAPAPAPAPPAPSPPAADAPAPRPDARPEPHHVAPAASPSRPATTGARSGLFAPRTAAADDRPSGIAPPQGGEARPTVADALQGIVMPCDLTPVVPAGRHLDPYRVAFSTDAHAAPEVGAAVGDELERLGFALESTTDRQLRATKGDTVVTVTLHTDPSSVTIAEAPAFPNLKPGTVVVEFQS